MFVDKVVLIPGICGSELMDGADLLWPGTPWNKVFSNYPDAFVDKLAHSRTVRPTGILRSVPLTVGGITLHHFDGYGQAFAALEEIGFSEQGGTLIPFAYDWRRDVRQTAATLRDFLVKQNLAGARVGIVAHSMGGLVARYLLERIGLPPGVTVSIAVLVAVPHLGAPSSLQNIIGLRPEIFLTAAQCKVVVGNPEFPSAYQLLPRANVPALLQVAGVLGYREEDILGDEVRQALNLSAGSLKAAEGLWSELKMQDSAWEPPCRYFAIVGNEQRTIAANYLGLEGVLAQALEEEGAGDGTVPLWSAASPRIPSRYVPSEHGSMFTDPRARQIMRALLRPEQAGDHPFLADAFETHAPVSVQPTMPSVQAGDPVNVALVADAAVSELHGYLTIELHLGDDKVDTHSIRIDYKGGPLRSLAIDLPTADEPALMRIWFDQAAVPRGREGVVLVLPST